MGYLTNFIVYTLAMVGVIVVALLVFKNSTGISTKNSSKFLRVKDTLSLSSRKTLYIISAGNEDFLLASDFDKTSLISKLGVNNSDNKEVILNNDFKETMKNLDKTTSYMDRKNLGIYKTQNKPYDSVMKNLAERIKG